ncbi:MAG TPA: hypothetical protein VK348_08485, partial [Planctomycetota bacterium]|nr:hypothetical protein [Planctomycetota bacterium]
SMSPAAFRREYGSIDQGPPQWRKITAEKTDLYAFEPHSTYIQEPPFFLSMTPNVGAITKIAGARALCVVGDSVTTDHISPAGNIKQDTPAGRYLLEQGVQPADFNQYGARRGNDRVMTRGTFANIRLRNLLVEVEGGYTRHLPSNDKMFLYDAAMRYQEEGTPLCVLAGKEYGTGSSRDWAAKGTFLLGVRFVLAESYERIHRSNLVGMGVLPLQYLDGESAQTLGLTGEEVFAVALDGNLQPRQQLQVTAANAKTGRKQAFAVQCRIDTPVEVEYFRNGGILQTVLRKLLSEAKPAAKGAAVAAVAKQKVAAKAKAKPATKKTAKKPAKKPAAKKPVAKGKRPAARKPTPKKPKKTGRAAARPKQVRGKKAR